MLNFDPRQVSPHFSYAFYKKQALAKWQDHPIIEQEQLAAVENLSKKLIGGDADYKVIALGSLDMLKRRMSELLNPDDQLQFINIDFEPLWEQLSADLYHKKALKDDEADWQIIQMVNKQQGKLAAILPRSQHIRLINLSGYFPYQTYEIQSEYVLIPFDGAIGMEDTGGVLLHDLNGEDSAIDKRFNYIDGELLLLWEKVLKDLKGQIDLIRRDYLYKAAVLEHAIMQNPKLSFSVEDKSQRPKSILAFTYTGDPSELLDEFNRQSVKLGYNATDAHFLIANFVAHSKEQAERLSDILMAI